MKSTIYSLLAVSLLTALPVAQAQETIAGWDMTGQPGNQSFTTGTGPVGVTVDSITRGSGVNPSAAANSFSSSGWDAGDDRYYSFGFEVEEGSQVNLTSLLLRSRSSNMGPRDMALKYSGDGFVSNIATWTSTSTDESRSLSLLSLPALTESTEFRIVSVSDVSANGLTTSSGGTFRVSNYFEGTTDTGSFRFVGSISGEGDPLPAPVVISTIPSNEDFDVPVTTMLSIDFNQNVTLGSGDISVYRVDAGGDVPVEDIAVTALGQVSLSGNTLTAALSDPLATSETYYILLDSGIVNNVDAVAFGGISDTTFWTFSTEGPDLGPVIVSLDPPTGVAGVQIPDVLTIEFDRDVLEGAGFISIYRLADDTLFAEFDVDPFAFAVFIDGSTVEVDLSATPLEDGVGYYIEIDESSFFDTNSIPFAGISGSSGEDSWFFTTFSIPALTSGGSYFEDFASFTSPALLPAGWSLSGPVTGGPGLDIDGIDEFPWGTGVGSGLRGDASVLGYQHTGSTATLEKILTLRNETGGVLTDLTVSYIGRVERISEPRSPAYSVSVGGVVVPALAFSAAEGNGVLKQANVTGLAIPDGEIFEIIWTSDNVPVGGGSRKQIGISDVEISAGAAFFTPSLAFPEVLESSITLTSAEVSSSVVSDGGASVTERGFVFSEESENGSPEIGGTGVSQLVDPASGTGDFSATLSGLDPATQYVVRAYATNSVGTSYSGGFSFSTLQPTPVLVDMYEQGFNAFAGVFPAGWSASGNVLNFVSGAWGAGTAGGFRGGESDPGVLGYQHSGSTGTLVLTLTLVNGTGAPLNQFTLSYLGRVARETQGRTPEWTVAVNGEEVPALFYSTSAGVDQPLSATVSGLNIAAGEEITITWSSTRGSGSGSSRQIGIANVVVDTEVSGLVAPVLSLASGDYFSDQTVFVTNFVPDTEVRYTLDGSEPDASTGFIYDDSVGILVADGNGPVTLSAVALDMLTSAVSPVTARTYNFPFNVADLQTLRAQTPGTGAVFRVTGETTYVAGTAFRNTKFFQDDSGFGIQIDDNPGIIETDYVAGENIAGLVGRLGMFQTQFQFVPIMDPGAAISQGNPLSVVDRTLTTLSDADQSRLVRLTGIVFDAGDGVAVFGVGGSTLSITDQNSNTGSFRNVFGESNVTGSIIPTELIDIVGVIQQTGTGIRNIAPRSLADITPSDTTPVDSSFEDYIADFFPDENNPDIIGLLVDPDGDGIANILEYYYGSDPSKPSQGLRQIGSDGSSVTFEFTRNSNLGDDIAAAYQWSTTLSDWFFSGDEVGGVVVIITEIIVDDTDPDVEVVQITATITEGDATGLFLRIEVSEVGVDVAF